jgi:hypothetical protein
MTEACLDGSAARRCTSAAIVRANAPVRAFVARVGVNAMNPRALS